MKNLLALLVASAVMLGRATAQTNIISFTNRLGEVFRDAEVTRVLPDGLWFKVGTKGGKVALEELPEDLRKRFGYSPETAAKAKADAAKAAKAAVVQSQIAAKEAERRRIYNQVWATRMTITGTALQVTSAGMRVKGIYIKPKPGEPPPFVGTALVTDYKTPVADGERVKLTVFANGTETYKSVGAGTLTIRRFTVDASKVTTPLDAAGFEALKSTKRD